jgi:AcrR family transcriptional regulator
MRRDAAHNQELILRTARDVFAEQGHDIGLDVIASRAGVGVGTVYRHFPSKDGLLDALVRIMFDDLIAGAEKSLARGDGTGLEVYLRVLSQTLADHHGFSSRFVRSEVESVTQTLEKLTEQLLAQAQEHGQISPSVTQTDLNILIWGLRGVVAAVGSVAPQAWERFLDVHLAGLRERPFPSTRPALSPGELDAIKAARRQVS